MLCHNDYNIYTEQISHAGTFFHLFDDTSLNARVTSGPTDLTLLMRSRK